MNTDRKLIEYYFFHYDEDFSTCSKKFAAFTDAMYPYNSTLLFGNNIEDPSLDFLNILMSKVIKHTYKHFRHKKRYIIKSRYFMKHKRATTCKNLDISPRTYHRYLDDILDYAHSFLDTLLLERVEYQRELQFLQTSQVVSSTQTPEYFSSHT